MTLGKIKNKLCWLLYKTYTFSKRSIYKFIKTITIPVDIIKIKKIIKNCNREIIVYPPTVDWNIPQFQRPQHLALELSKKFCFIYCTSNTYDKVFGVKKIRENLFLTNRFDLVKKYCPKCWLILHAAHPNYKYKDIINFKKKNWKIIYDYVDKIDPDICGNQNTILKRHNSFKNNDLEIILTTARNLYKEMIERFGKNKVLLNPNGVDYKHFQINKNADKIPNDLKKIIEQKKPIIGYYGALAKWIDYDLIDEICSEKEDYNIVLIGWNYDNSLDKIKKHTNLFYLGLKNYQELPLYATWFDVTIIPFIGGEIAKSTSPLKLFEYFALGKPVIVTKDLDECKIYKEVFVANNHKEFIEKIDLAYNASKDKKYINKVKSIALQNTWSKRATDIEKEINQRST